MEVAVPLPDAEKDSVVKGLLQRLKETSFFSMISARKDGDLFKIEGEFRDD